MTAGRVDSCASLDYEEGVKALKNGDAVAQRILDKGIVGNSRHFSFVSKHDDDVHTQSPDASFSIYASLQVNGISLLTIGKVDLGKDVGKVDDTDLSWMFLLRFMDRLSKNITQPEGITLKLSSSRYHSSMCTFVVPPQAAVKDGLVWLNSTGVRES